ncbi:hypothetical protein [Nocardioides zeicaulis]|uniref:Uncharacterized protein n=1 Tax=Nocardioides zeicaulis TaxID=1776857 RepID=A0ABV6DZX3_9ACTN
MTELDVRDSSGLSRRTVVRGAAWSVPVVSMAATAPAFASSTCKDGAYQVRWSLDYDGATDVATANRTTTSGTGTTGNAALTLTVLSTFNGRMQAGSANVQNVGTYSNLNVSPANIGGLGQRGLTIMQRCRDTSLGTPRRNNNQVITLKFNRPVWDLKFTLTDIDSNSGQYQDRIEISPVPPKFTLGGAMQGSGTQASPWSPKTTNLDQDPVSEGGGNVVLDYTGAAPAAEYTITYWNDQSGTLTSNGLQGVFVSNVTCAAETCTV